MTSFAENFPGELSVDHLSTEAIAALVDGELSRRAEHRAKIHLVHCESCRAEVRAQRSAAHRLREHVDGCRRPETLVDRVDLLLRKLQPRGK